MSCTHVHLHHTVVCSYLFSSPVSHFSRLISPMVFQWNFIKYLRCFPIFKYLSSKTLFYQKQECIPISSNTFKHTNHFDICYCNPLILQQTYRFTTKSNVYFETPSVFNLVVVSNLNTVDTSSKQAMESNLMESFRFDHRFAVIAAKLISLNRQ